MEDGAACQDPHPFSLNQPCEWSGLLVEGDSNLTT